MVELFELLTAFLLGAVTGLMYFGGLWWTVTHLSQARNPIALYLVSFGLRIIALLCVLFMVLQFSVLALMSSVIGVIVVRSALTRQPGQTQSPTAPLRNKREPV